MAEDYKYAVTVGKIGPLLAKIREVGVPDRAHQQWLASVGFTSSNDRGMLPVLRQIGFIDQQSAPTDLWTEYRAMGAPVLARAIRMGYQGLYKMYANAHARPSSDLEAYFKAAMPKLSQETVMRVVNTFRALVELAEFGDSIDFQEQAGVIDVQYRAALPEASSRPAIQNRVRSGSDQAASVGIPSLAVHIHLPESASKQEYDEFFSALTDFLRANSSTSKS